VAQAQWQYVTDDGVRTASLRSGNSLTPPAPFKGGPVTLSVTRGAEGASVKLDADAEMACSYAPTASSLDISFDSGPNQSFACAPAPAGARKLLFDGDHSTAYLADPVAFLARLKGARHITVTAGFAGTAEPQSLEFDLPPAAPAVDPPAAATAPVHAAAAVSPLPAATDAPTVKVDDQAGEGDHGHRRHHRHHGRR